MMADLIAEPPAAPAGNIKGSGAVTISDLSYRYGDRLALDRVSFSVDTGEIYGLLGPNGGGKTTLFKILSTITRPGSGEVAICGLKHPGQSEQVRRKLGVVFQNPSLDKKLRVVENLRHQGRLYNLNGALLDRRIEEMLALFGLSDRARDLVETLSGGLQRRVEIAKALLHQPEVLVLDEPSTGLDPAARLDLWAILDRIRKERGVTALMTTHLMEEADRCDRVAILHRGKLVAEGAPLALRRSVGGDVLQISSANPDKLAASLSATLGVEAAVVDQQVRIESETGIELLNRVMAAFAAEIQSISLSRPTLEDVFVAKTGVRLVSSIETPDTKKH